ncbi:MAG: hypothetical protein OEZ22_05975 [Spirochaetia bacterium]|nr:hypothetical protein [Spirochaetia bacterium]
MKKQLSEAIINLLTHGVEGTPAMIKDWGKMCLQIIREGLSEKIEGFHSEFMKSVKNFSTDSLLMLEDADEKDIIKELKILEEKEIVLENTLYNEYSLKDKSKIIFFRNNHDVFFLGNNLNLNPLQYARSRVKNFCQQFNINKKNIDEIIISVIEAAENAVKYSDLYTIAAEQSFNGSNYKIKMVNSTYQIVYDEKSIEEKFSEKSSLMRGVKVMNKLFDSLNIERDNEINCVTLVAKKECSK